MSTVHVYRGDGFTHSENDDCQKYELGVETYHLPKEAEGKIATIADFIPAAPLVLPDSDEGKCALMCGEYHHADCPIGIALRDCWCTPTVVTGRLPKVQLDPCSNPYSTVNADKHIQLEPIPQGVKMSPGMHLVGDGLVTSWKNKSVFCNPPYSSIMPWARKADEARAFIFLVNNVTTTKWYRELVHNGGSYKFEFDKRLKFSPPPRIKPSSNSRDQVLVCNREGWQMIGNRLDGLGRWWCEHVGYVG